VGQTNLRDVVIWDGMGWDIVTLELKEIE